MSHVSVPCPRLSALAREIEITMTSAPQADRGCALAVMDLTALDQIVGSIPVTVWGLASWASAVFLGRSLERLARGKAAAAVSASEVALQLNGNGVGARLAALGNAPD